MKKIVHADLLPLECAPNEVAAFVGEGTTHAVFNLSWHPIKAELRNGCSLILLFTDKTGVQKIGFLLMLNHSVLGKEYPLEDVINPEVPFKRLRGIGEIAQLCEMTFEELLDISIGIAEKMSR